MVRKSIAIAQFCAENGINASLRHYIQHIIPTMLDKKFILSSKKRVICGYRLYLEIEIYKKIPHNYSVRWDWEQGIIEF